MEEKNSKKNHEHHECKHHNHEHHECKHHDHDHHECKHHDHDHDEPATTVSLEDENGDSFEFEIIKTFEVDDDTYAALVPLDESEIDEEDEDDEEASELVLLKFSYEDGEEFLTVIEDDDEYDRVLDGLMKNLPEDYDIEVE